MPHDNARRLGSNSTTGHSLSRRPVLAEPPLTTPGIYSQVVRMQHSRSPSARNTPCLPSVTRWPPPAGRAWSDADLWAA